MSVLLYGCTTWTLIKCMKKKLDRNHTWILCAALNKYWKQHLTKQQLHGHLPPISQTIQVWQASIARHCWWSKDEHIWSRSPEHTSVGQPAKTYIHQLCADTGYCLVDFPSVIAERNEWRERVKGICAVSTPWWRWW